MAKQNHNRKINNLRKKLWQRDEGVCGICREPIPEEWVQDRSHTNIDHIRPKSHGGSDRIFNLQLVHILCNAEKEAECPGCESCASENKLKLWRQQNFRCARCEIVILPSEALDPGKADVGMTYGSNPRSRKGPDRIAGQYYLLHMDCISTLVRRRRDEKQRSPKAAVHVPGGPGGV